MEGIIEVVVPFLVDHLISGIIDFAKDGIFKALDFTYDFTQSIPDPPPFENMLPSLDVFTGLSAVLRVFLPIDTISKLLFFTVSFYALRIVYSGLKICHRSGLFSKLLATVGNLFTGFLGGSGLGGNGGSDSGGSDSGGSGGDTDV